MFLGELSSHAAMDDEKPSTSGCPSPFEAVVQLTRELQLADPYHNLTTLTLTSRGLTTLPDVIGELHHVKLLNLSDNPYAPPNPAAMPRRTAKTASNNVAGATLLCRADRGTGRTAISCTQDFYATSLG
jgi:hypothetical protein